MDLRPYGQGALFRFALLDKEAATPGLDHESGLTFAASDFQFASDEQTFGALTAEFAAFTSGSTKPKVGQTLTGATSTQTCVVIGLFVTSGSWGAGTAAGTIFVESVSGVFTAAENLNNTTTGDNNVMTLTADFTAGIGAASNGVMAMVALTSAEMQCTGGMIRADDQTATEVFLDDAREFATFGHPDAAFPEGGDATHLLSTKVAVVTSQTDLDLDDGLADADAANNMLVVIRDATVSNQKSVRYGSDYIISGNNLILNAAADFTVAVGDLIDVYAVSPILAEILADTVNIQSRLPAALVSGRIDASVGAMAANVVTAAAIATAAIDADSLATDAITAGKIAADAIGASELASDAVTEIVDAWKTAVGVISDAVNDPGAAGTASTFQVDTTVGADIRLGSLRFTSGALQGESRLVTWTGTTIAVVEPSSVPAGLETLAPFSAAPADNVTFDFYPI